MSLQPQTSYAVPKNTAEVACAAFPKGNRYMQMRTELGTLFQDEDFARLYPECGQPAAAPWRLALITIMQFAENLTDRQAADAVRARLDWKYALSLELKDSGFDFSVLSEFRGRLLEGEAEELLLNQMLALFKEKKLIKARGRQRTDSTHILAAVRELNRLELVGETMLFALNALTQVDPKWLRSVVPAEWYERYNGRFTSFRLPRSRANREVLADTIGHDGWHLMSCVYGEDAPSYLRKVPAVDILRQVWIQQYFFGGSGEDPLRWRKSGNLPPSAQMISSPYDLDARHSSKRGMQWKGYRMQITETCDPDGMMVITNVETTASTDQDWSAVAPIHDSLERKELLPSEHLADQAYLAADLLVESRKRYGVDLVGPIRPNPSWQAKDEAAYDISRFEIDFSGEVVTCPQGKKSRYWKPSKRVKDRGTIPMIQVHFHRKDCAACDVRSLCTRQKKGPRELTLHTEDQHRALLAARERQKTDAFWECYASRAGIEGTVSQGVRTSGMRRSRYRGQAKTHLQHVATAAAINLKRALSWLGETPRSITYRSPFSQLAAAA